MINMVRKKTKVKDWLDEIANKMGYELKKKKSADRTHEPENTERLDKMSSDELLAERERLKTKIENLKKENNKIVDSIREFMNKRGPNRNTQIFYKDKKLDNRKLKVENKQMAEMNKEILYINKIVKDKLKDELTKEFVDSNEEYKNTVQNIEPVKMASGDRLKIVIDKKKPKKEKETEKKNTDEKKDKDKESEESIVSKMENNEN